MDPIPIAHGGGGGWKEGRIRNEPRMFVRGRCEIREEYCYRSMGAHSELPLDNTRERIKS